MEGELIMVLLCCVSVASVRIMCALLLLLLLVFAFLVFVCQREDEFFSHVR